MIRRLLSPLNFQLRKPRCRKAAKIGGVQYPIRGRQAFRFSTTDDDHLVCTPFDLRYALRPL